MAQKNYGIGKEREVANQHRDLGRQAYRSAASNGDIDVLAYDNNGFYFDSVKATRDKDKKFNGEIERLKNLENLPKICCPNCKKEIKVYSLCLKVCRRGKWEVIPIN